MCNLSIIRHLIALTGIENHRMVHFTQTVNYFTPSCPYITFAFFVGTYLYVPYILIWKKNTDTYTLKKYVHIWRLVQQLLQTQIVYE